ncbi:MAG: carboxypeptidase-like regulatory domain-containing protein, partial [Salinibacter sp.]
MRPCVLGGLAFLLTLMPGAAGAQPIVVEGQVLDAEEAPVPYANVQVKGTTDGTATDGKGRFRFTTRRTGPVVLRASAVGYAPAERSIRLEPGDTTTVQFTLPSRSVQLDEAVVTGETYSTGPTSTATLNSTEAVTTPGAAGDLFRALQSFPGVAAPGDG